MTIEERGMELEFLKTLIAYDHREGIEFSKVA